MGWKNLRTHFGIEHNMCVTAKGICIGSGYVHDLAVVDPATGEVRKCNTFSDFLPLKYPALLAASKEEILTLLNTPDTFDADLVVYTYSGADIIEKKCEAYGYPNVTHDGEMMYENSHYKTKGEAIEQAIVNAKAGISIHTDHLEGVEAERKRQQGYLDEAVRHLAILEQLQQQNSEVTQS